MPSSQQSFEARINRFINANTLIQAWSDYAATNPFIEKTGLVAFIADVLSMNTNVDAVQTALKDAQGQRVVRCFKPDDKDAPPRPGCMEERIEGVANYIKGELGETSAAYKGVRAVLKKIKPRYKKKEPGAPRGSGNSPMEKSFASLVGHADTVITIISNMTTYTPPDVNLEIASMQTLRDEIKTLNSAVTTALDGYGRLTRARKLLYDGKGTPPGLAKRIEAIKSYLASFQGGKKSDHYIEFDQAIKGT